MMIWLSNSTRYRTKTFTSMVFCTWLAVTKWWAVDNQKSTNKVMQCNSAQL
jgi:hypothetical protein